MPGRQVILYDKRREAINKHNYYWFEIWGIDRHDRSRSVHRAELRAGRDELKAFGVITLDDFKAKIGNVMCKAVRAVRYIRPCAHDMNISRQPLDPLWQHVSAHVQTDLLAFTARIEPSHILEVYRSAKALEYKQQIMGNLAGLAVCEDIALADIPDKLSKTLRDSLELAVNSDTSQFIKTYHKARDRLQFITPKS